MIFMRTTGFAALGLILVAAVIPLRGDPPVWVGDGLPPYYERCGLFSDVGVRSVPVPHGSPTAIRIMPSRYADLAQTMAGYERMRLPLLAFDGTRYSPAGLTDDPGLYLYIPWLARHAAASLERTISGFLLWPLILASVLGALGLVGGLHGIPMKIAGLATLGVLVALAVKLADVYTVEYDVAAVVIPWALWWRRDPVQRSWFALFFVAGLAIGIAATVRSSAGLPVAAFLFLLILLDRRLSVRRRAIVSASVLLGLLLPFLIIERAKSARDQFLLTQAGLKTEDLSRHTFWHFAYIGLGLLSNPDVPGGVCDDVGKAKVKQLAPETAFLSRRYNEILRSEVLKLVRERPQVVVFNLAAKFGILLAILILFAHGGLPAAFRWPKDMPVEIAWWTALFLCMMPVVLYAPSPQYLLGLFSFAGFYGVFSIDHALTRKRTGSMRERHFSFPSPRHAHV